jgi:endo-1,4-beta-mannosidase
VTRSGTALTLGGQPYAFTGLNIYNANSRNNCWYSMGFNDNVLSNTLGQIGAGQEAFRAWFYPDLAGTPQARDWSAFDHTLAVAAAHNMHVIAQLSGQGGDCGDYPKDVQKYEPWYAVGYKTPEASGQSYRDWVASVVARYANNPTILAWQLVGEAEDPIDASGKCSATAGQTMRAFVDDVGGLIKSLDRNHLVNLSTIGSGQCGTSGADYQYVHASPYVDLCEYHDYGNPTVVLPGDKWNGMQQRINECHALNKAFFVGEIGIDRSDPDRAAKLAAKLAGQFAAGSVGELIWDWNDGREWHPVSGFDIGPGDPVLGLFAGY